MWYIFLSLVGKTLWIWSSFSEAQLFVVGLHVSDDDGHHVPQGSLPGGIQSRLLLHDFTNDLCNQLKTRITKNALKLGWRTQKVGGKIKPQWSRYVRTCPHVNQPHLEVNNGDLVLGGVAAGQRFEEGSVAASGLQQIAQFFQYCGTVGRNTCIPGQVPMGDAGKLGE